MTTEYYTTKGEIRGSCGHKHRSRATAERCLDRDAAGCRSQGGYSDRAIVVVDDEGQEWDDLGEDALAGMQSRVATY